MNRLKENFQILTGAAREVNLVVNNNPASLLCVVNNNQNLGIFLYRAIEKIDGEKGAALLPYRIAQRLKVWLLNRLI